MTAEGLARGIELKEELAYERRLLEELETRIAGGGEEDERFQSHIVQRVYGYATEAELAVFLHRCAESLRAQVHALQAEWDTL